MEESFMNMMRNGMNELITEILELKNEIQQLKQENEELKLNLVSMNPMYTNEQRAMAAQQLMQIQANKEKSSLSSSFK